MLHFDNLNTLHPNITFTAEMKLQKLPFFGCACWPHQGECVFTSAYIQKNFYPSANYYSCLSHIDLQSLDLEFPVYKVNRQHRNYNSVINSQHRNYNGRDYNSATYQQVRLTWILECKVTKSGRLNLKIGLSSNINSTSFQKDDLQNQPPIYFCMILCWQSGKASDRTLQTNLSDIRQQKDLTECLSFCNKKLDVIRFQHKYIFIAWICWLQCTQIFFFRITSVHVSKNAWEVSTATWTFC